MTLPASSTPRLLETCQFRLTGDGFWELGSSSFKTWRMAFWRSLDISLKAKFTIQMDSMFFYGEGMFMVFLFLFLTQYPATTSYLLTGLHYNRPDEFKLQIYI